MTNLIKLPKGFFDDHCERDLDTPEVVKETDRHYWVCKNDPAIKELKDDAEYYIDIWNAGGWEKYLFGLIQSAKATLKALEAA